MAIEVPIRLTVQGLQQSAIAQVNQVTFPGRAAPHIQRHRQKRMAGHRVAALGHRRGKRPFAVQVVTHGIVLTVVIVARGKQQG